MGAVPRGEDVGGVPDEEAPAVVDEDFKLGHLAAGDSAEAVVLLLVGGENVGEPHGAYLGVEAEGGVDTAVVLVAGVEGDGDGVGQRRLELAAGTFAVEGIAVGEDPGGTVAFWRAVVESEDGMVEVDEVAVGLDAEGGRGLHAHRDRSHSVARGVMPTVLQVQLLMDCFEGVQIAHLFCFCISIVKQ